MDLSVLFEVTLIDFYINNFYYKIKMSLKIDFVFYWYV